MIVKKYYNAKVVIIIKKHMMIIFLIYIKKVMIMENAMFQMNIKTESVKRNITINVKEYLGITKKYK
jgi:hypothetical protein